MNLRRSLLSLAPASLLVAATPVAARADIVPAPPAQASGVAAQVGSLLDVSQTGATAGSESPAAEASVVRLAGEPVLDLGGSQHGDGHTGGSLVDTGTSLPAQVQVAPWQATAEGSRTSTRHAHSQAAAARADAPGTVQAGVLTSQAEATHTDQHSTGHAVSDGADVNLLDAVRLVLLHSETTSDGEGRSYLVGLNGIQIGTDDQLGRSPLCALNLAGLADLSCLSATGGDGASGGAIGAAAQVAQLEPALEVLAALDPVAAFTTTSSGGSGGTPEVTGPADTPTTGIDTARAAAPPVDEQEAVQGAGMLPRTGTTAAPLAGLALALAVIGYGLRRIGGASPTG